MRHKHRNFAFVLYLIFLAALAGGCSPSDTTSETEGPYISNARYYADPAYADPAKGYCKLVIDLKVEPPLEKPVPYKVRFINEEKDHNIDVNSPDGAALQWSTRIEMQVSRKRIAEGYNKIALVPGRPAGAPPISNVLPLSSPPETCSVDPAIKVQEEYIATASARLSGVRPGDEPRAPTLVAHADITLSKNAPDGLLFRVASKPVNAKVTRGLLYKKDVSTGYRQYTATEVRRNIARNGGLRSGTSSTFLATPNTMFTSRNQGIAYQPHEFWLEVSRSTQGPWKKISNVVESAPGTPEWVAGMITLSQEDAATLGLERLSEMKSSEEGDPHVAKALIQIIKSGLLAGRTRSKTEAYCVGLLGNWGRTEDAEAVIELHKVKRLHDNEAFVSQSIVALGELGNPVAAPVLLSEMKGPQVYNVKNALDKLWPKIEKDVANGVSGLKDADGQYQCLLLMGERGGQISLAALEKLKGSSDQNETLRLSMIRQIERRLGRSP